MYNSYNSPIPYLLFPTFITTTSPLFIPNLSKFHFNPNKKQVVVFVMELIDQDDVFFADLSKQISLLIMDDDNDDQLPISHSRPSAPFQTFSRVIHPSTTKSQVFYEQSCKRDESKGTGVFIPRSTHPSRRKHKQQGRTFTSTASSNNFQKHSDSSTSLPHELLPISDTFHSFNYRRY